MEVKTVHGIMDVHIGAQYAEVYGQLAFPTLVVIWEAISEPKVEIHHDGSKVISWMAKNIDNGGETLMGISDTDYHYCPHLYPINNPRIKRCIEKYSSSSLIPNDFYKIEKQNKAILPISVFLFG